MLRNFFTVILSFLSGYYRCITGESTLFCLPFASIIIMGRNKVGRVARRSFERFYQLDSNFKKVLMQIIIDRHTLKHGGVPVKFITLTNMYSG